MKNYCVSLSKFIEAKGNKNIAQAQSKYMRFKFPFYGIMQKPLSEAIKEFYEIHGKVEIENTMSFVQECFSYHYRELWHVGLGILRKNVKKLPDTHLEDFKKIIIKGDWWDVTDSMASGVVGDYLQKYPHLLPEMDAWIQHENYWIRRTAIIYQLKYRKDLDTQRLFKYILLCAHEKEFFIRKAIGWSLREYSKTNARAVIEFIETHDTVLSGLSKREGMKWILANDKL